MSATGLNSLEKRAAFSLAGIFGMRMLGLFMILPVFTLYGQELVGYTPLLAGLAIGAYGLTQALLQIPMGLASDRWGRKKVITFGLILFALGSVLAASTDNIYGVIIGRGLQGMGAVAAAVMALAADLSREEQRPKVMAVIGMCIGLSFVLALVIGPMVAASYGLSGIFSLTAILAVLGIAVLLLLVPNAVQQVAPGESTAASGHLKRILANTNLLRLDYGVFVIHLSLTAVFVSLPGMLVETGLAQASHWKLYLPAMLVSFVGMVPLMIIGARKQAEKQMFRLAITLMLAAMALIPAFAHMYWVLVVATILFFVGFNYLEASMPSLLSRIAPASHKGAAMGAFSSSQFMGAFVGGALGGALVQWWGTTSLFVVVGLILVSWWVISSGLQIPAKAKNMTMPVSVDTERGAASLANQLVAVTGVMEATVVVEEGLTYLKVNEKILDRSALDAVLQQN